MMLTRAPTRPASIGASPTLRSLNLTKWHASWRRRLFTSVAALNQPQLNSRIQVSHHYASSPSQHRSISSAPDGINYMAREALPFSISNHDLTSSGGLDLASYLPSHDIAFGTELRKRDLVLGMSMDESMKNLRACLSVGRLDRAESILRKLFSTAAFQIQELQEANNIFLRGYTQALFRGTEGAALGRIQTWFEVDMRQLGIEPDATTLALMTRTAFLLASAKARERTIRRYIHMAEERGILEATIASGEYVEHEFNEVCRIRADLFKITPQEMEHSHEAEPEIKSESDGPGDADTVQTAAQHATSAHAKPTELKSKLSKSFGLATLMQSLKSFHLNDNASKMSEPAKRQWQVALEKDIVTAELERWRLQHAEMRKLGINTAMRQTRMEAMLWEWQEELMASVQKHITELQGDSKAYLQNDGPYLEKVGAQKLAAITILETIRTLNQTSTADGVKLYQVTGAIGSGVEFEAAVDAYMQTKESRKRQVKQRSRRSMLKLLRKDSPSEQSSVNAQAVTAKSLEQQQSSFAREQRSLNWPKVVKLRVAAMLLSKLVDIAKISIDPKEEEANGDAMESVELAEAVHVADAQQVVQEPAFSHQKIFEQGKRHGTIKLHPTLMRRLASEPPPSHLAHQLPMVAKPAPWHDLRGGYLRYPADLMRLRDRSGVQDMYLQAAIQEGAMGQVFKGLNVLGSTEWLVNRQIFDVMAELWNTGEAITNFPPADAKFVMPDALPETATKAEKWKRGKEIKAGRNAVSGFHSNRCFVNAQLEIARAFLGHSLYLPHNMDFRGRAYPIGGIFHHMGADNARGLFQFAKGKPLGEHGLYWLRVHLANKFGFDKANLQEREKFAIDHYAEIKDSAENPLTGQQWWLKAEDPWQCLAACFELVAAIESGNPTTFKSHLPVQQDGTCNGLQHYAALGGDSAGAAQVNLLPRDRPGDIYTEVARLVKEDVLVDAAQGLEPAKIVADLINRKIIKQPVMTYAYGVTFYGAKQQIMRRLDEMRPTTPDTEIENGYLAHYIATKVFKNFGAMFTGATKIQNWLATCAGRISLAISPQQVEHFKKKSGLATSKKNKMNNPKFQAAVIWTTPLNLPVVQPYRQMKSRQTVATALQTVQVLTSGSDNEVLKRKQMAGFPPNFIHSLDASHMLLSAVKCEEQKIAFAAVHDSFWTHACDIPQLNSSLRDAFVEIHSEDIIGRLAEEFRARYRQFICMQSVPAKSAFGKRVIALRKRQKKNTKDKRPQHSAMPQLDELFQEQDRLHLLYSEDAADRAKAETIETVASLYSALGPEHPDMTAPPEPADAAAPAPKTAKTTKRNTRKRVSADPTFADETPAIAFAGGNITPPEGLLKEPDKESARKGQRKSAKKVVSFWAPLDFPAIPSRGDFDISAVKDSTYFFS